MHTIRSVIYNIVFYLLVALMVILWLPMLILGPREASLFGFRIMTRCQLWGLEKICGTKLEIRGRENLPKNRPVIIASKHQSLWDIIIYFAILDSPVLVSKREINWIPVLGLYSRKIGTIIVDRSAGAKALKTMTRDVGDALEKKRTVVIFPEGTRQAPGAEPDYKPGIAALYTRLDHACVPVALNSGVFWPRRKILRYPGTIVLEFLPAIEPGMKRKDFMTTLQSSIEGASARLLTEAEQKN